MKTFGVTFSFGSRAKPLHICTDNERDAGNQAEEMLRSFLNEGLAVGFACSGPDGAAGRLLSYLQDVGREHLLMAPPYLSAQIIERRA